MGHVFVCTDMGGVDHTLAIAEAAREWRAALDALQAEEIDAAALLEVAEETLVAAVDAERADLERATPLTASEPPVSTTDAGRQRAYVGHGFTPSSGPFAPDSCRVQLSRYPCPDGRDAHDPSLPPEDLDAFGRIRRPDLERGRELPTAGASALERGEADHG